MSILYIETHIHNSHCQFVFRRTVGAICRARNNRYSIFSPPGREHAKQKVPKYEMRNPHMFYNNTNTKFNQVTRRSSCQFVYHENVVTICSTGNEESAYVLEQYKYNVQPSNP